MSAMDYDREREARETEVVEAREAREEADPPMPSWYTERWRLYGVLPGSVAAENRLVQAQVPVNLDTDREALDRLRLGYTPKAEATYQIELLKGLLAAVEAATTGWDVRIAVDERGFLRVLDRTSGTMGFLGPICDHD